MPWKAEPGVRPVPAVSESAAFHRLKLVWLLLTLDMKLFAPPNCPACGAAVAESIVLVLLPPGSCRAIFGGDCGELEDEDESRLDVRLIRLIGVCGKNSTGCAQDGIFISTWRGRGLLELCEDVVTTDSLRWVPGSGKSDGFGSSVVTLDGDRRVVLVPIKGLGPSGVKFSP